MMDRFRSFADDVGTVKRFAGDAKYLYKFGKNIYDTLFRRHVFKSDLDNIVSEYLRKNKEFYVCFNKRKRTAYGTPVLTRLSDDLAS